MTLDVGNIKTTANHLPLRSYVNECTCKHVALKKMCMLSCILWMTDVWFTTSYAPLIIIITDLCVWLLSKGSLHCSRVFSYFEIWLHDTVNGYFHTYKTLRLKFKYIFYLDESDFLMKIFLI